MANQPIQYPNIDLPGAEFFSFAPNRTIALQGRRRKVLQSPVINGPADTDGIFGLLSVQLEQGFLPTSGIYLHYFWVDFTPALGGIFTLQNAFAGLSLNSASPQPVDYPLGQPVFTTPNAFVGIVVLTDRERMVSARDILPISGPQSSNLVFTVQITANNTTPAASTFTIQGGIIYTRLDGLVE